MPTSPISYALPARDSVESDEDWSRISDRTKKKRLQNRVAQREYRRRTRDLIEELTTELEQYRRQAQPHGSQQQQPLPGGGSSEETQTLQQPLKEQQRQQQYNQQQQQQQSHPVPSVPTTTHHQEQQSAPHPTTQPLSVAGSLIRCDPPFPLTSNDENLSLNLQASLSSITQRPQARQTASIPTSGGARRRDSQQAACFTTLTADDEAQQIQPTGAADQVTYYDKDNNLSMLSMDISDHSSGQDSSSGDGHDLFAGSGNSSFMLPGFSPSLTQTQPRPQNTVIPQLTPTRGAAPNSMPILNPHHPPPQCPTPTTSQGQNPPVPPPPPPPPSMDGSRPLWDASPGATAPLEDRFDFLFNLMQHAGFGSVDNLLETWYTGDFDDASPLRQEQRLSRHRGLTALLARLRDATDGWSKWERWGYREETLLGAESILQAEFAKLTQGQGQLSQHVAGLGRDRVEATKGLKRCLQRELPQLRTLLTALNVELDKTGRQANHKAVDAATMILALAGRVSETELLALLAETMQGASRAHYIHQNLGAP